MVILKLPDANFKLPDADFKLYRMLTSGNRINFTLPDANGEAIRSALKGSAFTVPEL